MVQNHVRPPRFILQPDWEDALKFVRFLNAILEEYFDVLIFKFYAFLEKATMKFGFLSYKTVKKLQFKGFKNLKYCSFKGETVHSKLHKCRKNDSSQILTSSNPNVEAEIKFGVNF